MLDNIGIYHEDGMAILVLNLEGTILSYQSSAKFSTTLLLNCKIGRSLPSCINSHAEILEKFNYFLTYYLQNSKIVKWEDAINDEYFEFTLSPLLEPDQILLTISEQNKLKYQEKIQTEREIRLKRQSKALFEITASESLFEVPLEEAYRQVCFIVAAALSVKYIGLWYFEENDTKLNGKYLYNHESQSFDSPIIIETSANAIYYESVFSNSYVIVKDTFTDERTLAFYEYCTEFNVHALIDVPLLYKGKIIGVICIEHIEEPRDWHSDEIEFAQAVASSIMILQTSFERKLMLAQLEKVLRERNKMRRELDFEVEKNVQLYESSGVGIALVQQDKIIDVNPKWLELFKSRTKNDFIGLHPAEFSQQIEIQGKTVKEIFDEQAYYAYQQKFKQIEWEFFNLRKEKLHTLLTLSTFRLRGESFLQLSVQDITQIHQYQLEIEQKNQQLQLQEEEMKAYIEEINSIRDHTQVIMDKSEQELELLQSFLDSSSDVIIAWDSNFRFLHFNQAAKKASEIIGVPLITGGNVRELVSNEEWENIQTRTREALKGQVIKAKTKLVGRSMSVIYTPLRNKFSENWAVLVIFREDF